MAINHRDVGNLRGLVIHREKKRCQERMALNRRKVLDGRGLIGIDIK